MIPPADPEWFGKLVFDETVRRNRRKTPAERVETLIGTVREAARRGALPQANRRLKEQRLLCSIRERLLKRSIGTGSSTS